MTKIYQTLNVFFSYLQTSVAMKQNCPLHCAMHQRAVFNTKNLPEIGKRRSLKMDVFVTGRFLLFEAIKGLLLL